MEELEANLEALGGEARRRDEGATSSRSSRALRERKEENGRALSECEAPWCPCQRRRPDERGHRRCTGAIWRTGVALDIHDGELGSDSGNVITD